MARATPRDMARGTGSLGHVLRVRWMAALIGAAIVLASGSAGAHLDVLSPAPRSAQLKQGPCGGGADEARGEVVHSFRPGQTITVTWDEYVDHPGHFRISFDADGQDDFVDPASFEDVSGNPSVLIDGIPDRAGGGSYTQEVTLPAVSCDRCTLQVVQVMTDKPPHGDGNDLYYQCVDLVLGEDAEAEATTVAEGESGGCDIGRGGAGTCGGLLAWLVLARRRRARRRPDHSSSAPIS